MASPTLTFYYKRIIAEMPANIDTIAELNVYHKEAMKKAVDSVYKDKLECIKRKPRFCNCATYMDIRGRCEPNCPTKNTKREWKACPARFDTAVFCIGNTHDEYHAVEKKGIMDNEVKSVLKKKYMMNEAEWREVAKIFNEKDNIDEETE